MDQQKLVLVVLLILVSFTIGDTTEEPKKNDDNGQNDESSNAVPSDNFETLTPQEQSNLNEEDKTTLGGKVLSEKQSTLPEADDESIDSNVPHKEASSEKSTEMPTENQDSGEDGFGENADDHQSSIISKVLVVKDNITGHKHSSFSEDKSTDRGDEKTAAQVKEEAEKRIEEKEKERQNVAAGETDKDTVTGDEEHPEESEEYSPDLSFSGEGEEKGTLNRNSIEESPPVEEATEKVEEDIPNMDEKSTQVDEKLDQDVTSLPEEGVQDTPNPGGLPDTGDLNELGVQENLLDTEVSDDSFVQDSSSSTPPPSEQDDVPIEKTAASEKKTAEGVTESEEDAEEEDIMKEDKLYRAVNDETAETVNDKKTETESTSGSNVGKGINKVDVKVLGESKTESEVTSNEALDMKSDSVDRPVLKKQEKKIQPGAALYDEAIDLLKEGKKDVKKAYKLLAEAAFMNNTDAAEKIAYPFMFGDNIKRNRTKAIHLFHLMAERGIPLGQQGLGFVYGAGLSVNSSQAKALIYTTFGALGGNAMAHMMLGYRYFNGIGVAKSCESALTHYKKVAKKVTDETTSHGGNAVQRVRLYDELEQPGGTSAQIDEDLLQYYQFLADKGDLQAQVGLGQLYFQGGRGIDVNYEKAFKYFQLAGDVENGNGLAYLGKMYLDGLHVQKDQKKAFDYFTKAAAQSNPIGQAGLGMIYLKGAGVPKDYDQAMKYFSQAAEQGWVEGQLQLGNMYYNGIGVKKDYRQAVKYFTFASQSGHVMAFYNLASMHATGAGVMRSCNTAAELFKNVAERGKWSMMFMDAYDSYRAGDLKTALLKYYYLAELGYEVAQSNVAYVLEKGEMSWFSQNETYARALLQWSRAASQGYAVARVKVGDYHFYGYGTKVDYDTSALHYRMASDQQNNPQAMFNLGYMHERGFGLKEDIHLAKRFYDMAAEASPDAHFPVTLALLKLSLHFMYEWLQNNYKFWEYAPIERIKLLVLQKLGPDWDMYLITLLAVVLGGLLLFRRTLRR